jgi:hypothetical protein
MSMAGDAKPACTGVMGTQCFNRFLILTSVHPFSRADTTDLSATFVYANSHSTSSCIMSIENPEHPSISMSTSTLPTGKAGILPDTCQPNTCSTLHGPNASPIKNLIAASDFPFLVLVRRGYPYHVLSRNIPSGLSYHPHELGAIEYTKIRKSFTASRTVNTKAPQSAYNIFKLA